MPELTPSSVQILALLLFAVGLTGALTRRSVLVIVLSIELMLNAVSLSLVGFARSHADVSGQVFVLLIALVAVAEAAVGLALLGALIRARGSTDVEDFALLRW